MSAPTEYAVQAVETGFVDKPEAHYDPDELATATRLTPEDTATPPERLPKPTSMEQTCEFRKALGEAMHLGDLVLSIDVRRTAADVYLYPERGDVSSGSTSRRM